MSPQSSSRRFAAVVTAATAAALTLPVAFATTASSASNDLETAQTFVVLAKPGTSSAAAVAAIESAGGEVKQASMPIGVFTVTSRKADFAVKANAAEALEGVTTNTRIGLAKDQIKTSFSETMFAEAPEEGPVKPQEPKDGKDSLSFTQWDMDMLKMAEVHKHSTGKGVKVGIMDTGVDGHHPDIKPNFDFELSRNFTTDIPELDGPCEEEPDKSCEDPSDVDEGGHGTHVAGSVAAAANKTGIIGMAPEATIVNLRVGQDSGYFFLDATLNALVYAAQNGIDVVNMSYYIDPWAFNCRNNPADSPEEQKAQQVTIDATNRALRYARMSGVTLIAAAGNGHTDLDNPTVDKSSPNLPEGSKRERQIDNSCLDMPTEGDGVLSVSSVGPSGTKADYSNWGLNDVAIAAPGGYYRDLEGTNKYKTPNTLILSPYPTAKAIARLKGQDAYDEATGESKSKWIVSECPDGKESCAYYTYMQGTSMAAPHATGAMAAIIGKHGRTDANGEKSMSAYEAEMWLLGTAKDQPCPEAGWTYPERDESYQPDSCKQVGNSNSWYGAGIINPLRAVSARGATRHIG